MRRYNYSISKLLSTVYPEYTWDPLRFSQAPRNYWASLENQRAFLEDLAKKIGLKENDMSGWYKVTNKVVFDNGGHGLLDQYDGNLPRLLQAVYPDYSFDSWKFSRRIGKVTKDPKALNDFLTQVESRLGIKNPSEWYRISPDQFAQMGLERFFQSWRRGLFESLKERYPNEKWSEETFLKRSQKKKTNSNTEKTGS